MVLPEIIIIIKKSGCKKYIINPIIYDRLSNGYKDKRLPGNTCIR